ncbi:MAG TPA: Na/Pi cotransporter family protein [Smithellaceae bacterium]|jgi:phosphate:Na+ symporter|nr:Na/Pi cotransporter family protein [Smithellaceae bacterium]HQM46515.1 Na/Pi cotransporter family protein [Smithellaceae bacterium]
MKEVFTAASGVVFFLIGMIRLSSAVRRVLNARIKEYVKYAVEKPVYGLLTGMIATIIFQSSSASTALTIGLVSAGLISFYHSLAILLGADIGATLTVQFVIWRFTEISPVFIALGGILWLARQNAWKTAGEMIFYFGLIFFGLNILSQAAAPLRYSPVFLHYFAEVQNPVYGVMLGLAATAIVQASAITIGILAILAQQGLIGLESAVPVVLGANVGTTVTALLAGAASGVSGKRTALSHLIFKCAGALICLCFLPFFFDMLKRLSDSVPQQIVWAHFLMNMVIVVVFIFFLRPFAAMMQKILPGKDETLPVWPEYLDRKALEDPARALEHVLKEIQRQAKLLEIMLIKTTVLMRDYQEGKGRDIGYIEMVVSNLRSQIVRFLLQVSGRHLTRELSRRILAYTAMADDLKSIGSHIQAINLLCQQKALQKIRFSDCGEAELREIVFLVQHNLEDASALLHHFHMETVKGAICREEDVDVQVREALDSHLKRFHLRQCSAQAGPIFVEMLGHLERISDLCNNIVEYVWDTQSSV